MLGSTNAPGKTGMDAAEAKRLAAEAKAAADNVAAVAATAKSTADTAKATADAALAEANDARSTADTAKDTADAAAEEAASALSTANGIKATADDALAKANAAQTAADSAVTAAANAQQAANDAAAAVTDYTNTIFTVPSQSGTLTYNGSSQTPTFNGYDSAKMTLNVTAKTNAGTYDATVTPKSGFKWPDGTTTTKTIPWTIGRATVNVPTSSGNKTYTGSEQTAGWNGYDSSKMTIDGTIKGTNASTYTASFTPGANYCWPDGSTTAKNVSWTIDKAAGSLSLNKTSITADSTVAQTITATKAGDGAVSATSSNTSVATVSVNGNTVTVTPKGNGSATITVKVAAGTNHTAPANATCSVTVALKPSAGTSAASGVSYTSGISSLTPAQLSEIAESISNNSAITNATSTVYIDHGTSHWKLSVGDKIAISMNGANYDFQIIGFNHDDLDTATAYGKATATGKAGISFQMVDCFATTYVMNSTSTNSGGWKSSAMRTSTMATLKGYLSAAWKSAIKTVKKKASAGNQSSTIETMADDFFLLSEVEIFGSTTYSVAGEGNQYAWYKAGNTKVKKLNGSAYAWWERSPFASGSTNFCFVDSYGSAYDYVAGSSYGVAPGFCV